MFIIKKTVKGKTTLQRTSDYIEAIITLANSESAELYEKQDKQPAKQIGYTSKETEQ